MREEDSLLTQDENQENGSSFAAETERAYQWLIATESREAGTASDAEAPLGGRLFYVGELDAEARPLLVAANIAGAASLAATADIAAQKQAVREGVTDFLVTSLDEALRILKNEIRKRETVTVCIALDPHEVETEMIERGVLPDLLAPATPFAKGRSRVERTTPSPDSVLLSWSVANSPARWLPRLDAIAMESLGGYPAATGARRWLRLAPRYLGRLGGNVRLLRCSRTLAEALHQRFAAAVQSSEIAVPVRVAIDGAEQTQSAASS